MKYFALICLCLSLVSCDNKVSGIFTANQDLVFHDDDRDGGKEIQVARGQYDGTITFKRSTQSGLHQKSKMVNSSRQMKLRLERDNVDHHISFRIPKTFKFKENSTFKLDKEFSGQPYDLLGENITTVNYSEPQEMEEQCSRTIPYVRCWVDQYGNRVCRTILETHYGYRRVKYRQKEVVSTNNVLLYEDGDNQGDAVADFVSEKRDFETQYLEVGYCYVYGNPYPYYP